jgi:D-alanyl-D-alanine carboxypeptidase (penicillin-binding protein 5/6)
VALAEGVGGTLENFVEHDEPPGAGLGPEEHAVQERHRPDRARPLQQRARRGRDRRAHHQRHPSSTPLLRAAQYTFNNIKQDNRNMLLGRDPAVDGMKTGYTEAAGYCLVASASATARTASAACSAW